MKRRRGALLGGAFWFGLLWRFWYIYDVLALALGGFVIGDDLAILEEPCYMLETLFMMP